MEPNEYVAAIARRWLWVLSAGFLGAALGVGLALQTPVTFRSVTSVYVDVPRIDVEEGTGAGVVVQEGILPSFAELVRSPAVLAPVADRLGLQVTPRELAESVSVEIAEDTSIVRITVVSSSPEGAARLAEAVERSARDVSAALYEGEDGSSRLLATTVQPAREPRFRAAPNTRIYAALGMVGGLGLACLLCGFTDLVRPRVRGARDVGDDGVVAVLLQTYAADPGRPTLEGQGVSERTEGLNKLRWLLQSTAKDGQRPLVGLVRTTASCRALVRDLQALSGSVQSLVHATSSAAPDTGAARTSECTLRVIDVTGDADVWRSHASAFLGLVVVADRGRTTRKQLRRSIAEARGSTVPLLGVVIDGMPPPRPSWRARLLSALTGNSWATGTETAAHPLQRENVRPHLTSGQVTAVAALLGLGFAYPLPLGATTGLIATVALIPVWARTSLRYRGARLLYWLTGLGLASGILLAFWRAPSHDFAYRQATETGFLVITAVCGVGLILWARTLLPLPVIGLAYGLGALAMGLLRSPGEMNPWKFELWLPMAIVLLSLVGLRRRPAASVLALVTLGGINVVNDARSAFGFCVIAAALVMWQARPGAARPAINRLASLTLLAAIAYGAYTVISELLVAGVLGPEVQARTVIQIAQSGSLLLGGRPEWTATWALMQHQPIGFGLGTVPNPEDVMVGKAGIAVTNIPTAEAYLRNYLLDGWFELHSIIADLWTNLGPVGLVLGLAMSLLLVQSLAELLSQRRAPALICLLVLISLWYLAFGPLPSNLPEVSLALGLVLLPRARTAASAPVRRADAGDLE